jgi:putative NADH-flavin reductase
MRVALIGAGGAAGSRLLRELVRREHEAWPWRALH